MVHREREDYLLAMHLQPGLGAGKILQLLQQQGLEALCECFEAPHRFAVLTEKQQQDLKNPDWEGVEQIRTWAQQDRHTLLTWFDPRYPELLKQIPDAPLLLYASGQIEALQEPQLAIVGSRHCSRQGEQLAFEMAAHLGRSGLSICSGMALGIDAQAHRGALSAQAPTLAVLGTGIDRIYPARHRDLAHQIFEQGLLLSELPLGSKPLKGHFPRRNRIISGLSVGTLVVEASLNSGSLITAQLALDQGREVFAIPGSIHNPLAKGCHRLIRQGAQLVETAQEILLDLQPHLEQQLEADDPQPHLSAQPKALDEAYQNLLECMGFEPVGIDELALVSGLTTAEVSSMLLILELEGLVLPAAGGHYQRTTPRRA